MTPYVQPTCARGNKQKKLYWSRACFVYYHGIYHDFNTWSLVAFDQICAVLLLAICKSILFQVPIVKIKCPFASIADLFYDGRKFEACTGAQVSTQYLCCASILVGTLDDYFLLTKVSLNKSELSAVSNC